ncbi:hypothetical protein [Streptomyces sp. NPDC005322]|uniref:hypothetical protein n=1 Tax=Streptomyces sp. NPDC005322 TaxID=3157032 RepID=UPI0033AD400B
MADDRDSQHGGPTGRSALDELIADLDEVNGPADPNAVADKLARLTGEPHGVRVTRPPI